MAPKRAASKQLTQDNWDEDDERVEDLEGPFTAAPEHVLLSRKIRVASRRLQRTPDDVGDEPQTKKGLFAGFTGFNKTSSANATSSFSFISNLANVNAPKNDDAKSDKKETAAPKTSNDSEKSESKKVTSLFGGFDSSKIQPPPATRNGKDDKPENVEDTTKTPNVSLNKWSEEYYVELKNLNVSVSEWIKSHVDKNPYCILTPIFNDYIDYLKELERLKGKRRKGDDEDDAPSSFGKKMNESKQFSIASKTDSDKTESVAKSSTSGIFGGSSSTTLPKDSTFSFLSKIDTVSKSSTTLSLDKQISDKSPFKSIGSSESVPNKSTFGGFSSTPVSTMPMFSYTPRTDSSTNKFLSGFSSTPLTTANTIPRLSATELKKDKSDESNQNKTSPKPNGGSETATNAPIKSIFGGISTSSASKLPSFSFMPKVENSSSTPFSFGTGKPFALPFGQLVPKESTETSSAQSNEDNEDEEPPKTEFTPVVEEDSVYSKRCKVFVKKDNVFGDRGVGVLYIKPIKDSEKYQAIVRADTSLGNLLLNIVLTDIPMQRTGKNNVMFVCVPVPDGPQTPVATLLRVKTGEEADEVLDTLNKYKK